MECRLFLVCGHEFELLFPPSSKELLSCTSESHLPICNHVNFSSFRGQNLLSVFVTGLSRPLPRIGRENSTVALLGVSKPQCMDSIIVSMTTCVQCTEDLIDILEVLRTLEQVGRWTFQFSGKWLVTICVYEVYLFLMYISYSYVWVCSEILLLIYPSACAVGRGSSWVLHCLISILHLLYACTSSKVNYIGFSLPQVEC